ncbi:hypothetical protein [Flavobacterium sp.]
MKKILFITITLFAISACKNNSKIDSTTAVDTKSSALTNPDKVIEKGCYTYSNNGSVVRMEVTENDNQVAGTLKIAYAEKDASTGTFIGKMNGDKLMATYTFSSEGKQSTREIAFQLNNNQLIEGYAEMDETGTTFKDATAIVYDSNMPLSKVMCSN